MRRRQERGGSREELIPEFQRTGKNLPGKGVKGWKKDILCSSNYTRKELWIIIVFAVSYEQTDAVSTLGGDLEDTGQTDPSIRPSAQSQPCGARI